MSTKEQLITKIVAVNAGTATEDSTGTYHSQNDALRELYDKGVNRQMEWSQVAAKMKEYKRTIGNTLLPTAKF